MEEEVGKMLGRHQDALRVYIRGRLRDRTQTEEMLSDVNITIMKLASRFQPDKPFLPWAMGVARRVVSRNVKKENRQRVILEHDVTELLVLDAGYDLSSESEARKEALDGCLALLPQKFRMLIRHKYDDDLSYLQISNLCGKTPMNLHTIFRRLHLTLQLCVERQMERL